MNIKIKILMLITVLFVSVISFAKTYENKHRLLVLTDIEAEVDDTQTMIRLLLYSNVIDIEGLIATTSTHLRDRVAPDAIHKLIDAYSIVQPNLLVHEPEFPDASQLHLLVKQGIPLFGMAAVGEGFDSEGSEWIIKCLEKDDERPLWISVWGGPNTLAQALWKIRETKSRAEAKRLISKLRVYTISDQDDSGNWMRKEFPDLFYIVSPGSYFDATWSAIMQEVQGIDNSKISNPWIAENLQQGHGPLGTLYPDVAYGVEGDTPSWLSLIPTGLNSVWDEHPDYGGWGGRYELYTPVAPETPPDQPGRGTPLEPETRPIWTNAEDTYIPKVPNYIGRTVMSDTMEFTGNHVTLWRWRDDFQNDFAARMDWCTHSYNEANHPPVSVINGPDQFTVKSGELLVLNAGNSYDPDGDNLSFLWIYYPEAGTFKGDFNSGFLADNRYNYRNVRAPQVETPKTMHFILKVTDKGTPALSRYKRVIVTIEPK